MLTAANCAFGANLLKIFALTAQSGFLNCIFSPRKKLYFKGKLFHKVKPMQAHAVYTYYRQPTCRLMGAAEPLDLPHPLHML